MRALVTMSHCLHYDLSILTQGHLISLQYLQQASGPRHPFSLHIPSIPSCLTLTSSLSLPLLSRSYQIGSSHPDCGGCKCEGASSYMHLRTGWVGGGHVCIRDCAWLQPVRASAELGLNIYLLILCVKVCVVSCGNVFACMRVCVLVFVCGLWTVTLSVWPHHSTACCH